MISAKEARTLFKTEEELKEKRINEIVDQVLSLFEQDIIREAKENNWVSIPILFGSLRKYEILYGGSVPVNKDFYIDKVDNKSIIYNNGIRYNEFFEVVARVFYKLSKLGYTSNLDFHELSTRDITYEGVLYTVKISWE